MHPHHRHRIQDNLFDKAGRGSRVVVLGRPITQSKAIILDSIVGGATQ
jgi:hypothetical protein